MTVSISRHRVSSVARMYVLLAMVSITNASAAAAFSNLWIFGDSYSDVGNFYISSGNQVPSSAFGFSNGRYSDGPIWADHLAAGLGLSTLTPGFNTAFSPGNNLAVGGAMTNTLNSQLPTPGTGMRSQVDGFLTFYNPFIPNGQNSSSLFVLFGGANNGYLWTSPFDLNDLAGIIASAMADIDGMVRDLHDAGAQSFMIPNLPGYSVVDDWFSGTPQGTLFFAQQFNASLADTIAALRAELGVTIIEVDFFGLFQSLLASPPPSITNVSQPCLDMSASLGFEGLCSNPEAFLMFDALHPSAATHALMGEAALSAVPLPTALPLFVLALAGLVPACGRRGRDKRSDDPCHSRWAQKSE